MKRLAILMVSLPLMAQEWGAVHSGNMAQEDLWAVLQRQQQQRPRRHFTRGMAIRAGIHVGLAALDFHSTTGQRELNPLIRNSEGRISGPRFLAVNIPLIAAAITAEYLESGKQSRAKRLAWAVIGGRAAIVINNYRLKGGAR